MLTRYFEAQGRVRKALSVVKKRSGMHEDTIREFAITSAGLVVGEPLRTFQGVLTGMPQFKDNHAGSLLDSAQETEGPL
jgi:circadian clock protein KaiC